MTRRIVASLHGANGVVIKIIEDEIINGDVESSLMDLMDTVRIDWKQSVANGCRVVIGIPNDNAN
jgi:hypothetical protein